ncbi:MAG: GNAT family N-acetyltransferase [Sulfuricaulis sp.]
MIAVRPAEQRDAEAAIDVVRRSISQLCLADHHNDHETLTTWLANKTPQSFVTWLCNPDNFCVVAESNSNLLGVGVLQRRGEILLFYLAPGSQRQGIGKRIHAALEEKATQWGLTSLHLDSTALACPFYEALGYRPIGLPIVRFGVLRCFPYAKQLQPNNSLKRTAAGRLR